ncbi:MAG: hypothetical protein KDA91_25330, partial [Planctomycetaceae bacterium]|nr:hypothetical protein [Planctomycetaceae bacterium]
AVSLYTFNQPAVFESLGWEPLFRVSEPFLYFSIWAFLITAAILVIGSLMDSRPTAGNLEFVLSNLTRNSDNVPSKVSQQRDGGAT